MSSGRNFSDELDVNEVDGVKTKGHLENRTDPNVEGNAMYST